MTRATFDIRHYNRVRDDALDYLPEIASRLVPNGSRHGAFWAGVIQEGEARFPGSYVIDLRSGHCAMMTDRVVLHDIIKAVAFLENCSLKDGIHRTENFIGAAHKARLAA